MPQTLASQLGKPVRLIYFEIHLPWTESLANTAACLVGRNQLHVKLYAPVPFGHKIDGLLDTEMMARRQIDRLWGRIRFEQLGETRVSFTLG